MVKSKRGSSNIKKTIFLTIFNHYLLKIKLFEIVDYKSKYNLKLHFFKLVGNWPINK